MMPSIAAIVFKLIMTGAADDLKLILTHLSIEVYVVLW